jgi:hypothetical protein
MGQKFQYPAGSVTKHLVNAHLFDTRAKPRNSDIAMTSNPSKYPKHGRKYQS